MVQTHGKAHLRQPMRHPRLQLLGSAHGLHIWRRNYPHFRSRRGACYAAAPKARNRTRGASDAHRAWCRHTERLICGSPCAIPDSSCWDPLMASTSGGEITRISDRGVAPAMLPHRKRAIVLGGASDAHRAWRSIVCCGGAPNPASGCWVPRAHHPLPFAHRPQFPSRKPLHSL